jgi:LmbE family N-acetylglucosaminyl deacetylase
MASMLNLSEIERVLVVTAHPDDVDFGAAGTVANMTDAGIEVVYCLVTDGQAGGFDHSIPRDEMASIRRDEQTNAAAEVGVSRLVVLGHMDGAAVADMSMRHDISKVIREVRPQVVITHNPMRNLDSTYGSHPDARNPFAFPGTECAQLEDWAVSEVWVMLGAEANDFVDITEQLDRKIRALRCHESQHRDPDAMEERVREWWKSIAAERGRPEGSSAEAFRVVDTQ